MYEFEVVLKKGSRRPVVTKETAIPNMESVSGESPDMVVDAMRIACRGLDSYPEEHVYVVALNARNKVIGYFLLSVGTERVSFVSTRIVFQKALLVGASSIILIHTHPSGDVTASKEDIAVTNALRNAGEVIGVPLLDSIIVGDGKIFSFMAEGMMDCNEMRSDIVAG